MKAETNMHLSNDAASYTQRLQKLYMKSVCSNEAERQQFADYLNDTSIQSLSALHIQLSMQANVSPLDWQDQIMNSLAIVVDLIEGLTMITRGLRPLELYTLGLPSALQQTSEEFSKLARIPVTFEKSDIPPLSDKVTITLYRFAQEALTNILKHAQATEVWVRLFTDETAVYLTIQDNGCGFHSKGQITDPIDAPGLGLLGIMLRIQALSGQVIIDSLPREGTIVTAQIPLHSSEISS